MEGNNSGREISRRMDTKKISVLAMLSALAFIVMAVGRVPVVLFLRYDPKDVIITIGGFLYGPLAAFIVTAVVAFVEMITVSDNGFIGLLMNIIAGCSFACTASFIYQKKRTLKGAVLGLLAAWIITTAVMVMWNYLITPVYMKIPREVVVGYMLPAFIPFNLLKGGLNAAITMLLYKPVRAALSAYRMTPPVVSGKTGKLNAGVVIASVFVIVTCVLWILVLQGIL
ncbi:MAG: ECF transporter S component [Clostridia bacterium]|nr:ECF transporter S component [Clostridia bacterium]